MLKKSFDNMMIEVFTKKRILVLAAFVVLFTVAFLVLRSHWEYTRQLPKEVFEKLFKIYLNNFSEPKETSCPVYTSISRCQRCPKDELRAEVPYCKHHGYKEKIRCEDGKEEFVGCDISPAVEEAEFWKFELLTLLVGLTSYAVVYLRQKKLDKKLMEKINKQIAAGI
ncbi:unnamed protein product [Lymnaea stagnalis]|uniref:Uncharacterized protein n=1 Tax=Lymnaea stagnalis TaxID=6523 RepID=A0AAV2I3I4_LYMST